MPFGTVKLKPGVQTEPTPTLNEAGISAANFIRFRQGLVEKVGGWQPFFASAFPDTIKELHAWQDLNNESHLAVGSTTSLRVITDGQATTITPQVVSSSCPVSFSTTAASTTITVVDSNLNGGTYPAITSTASVQFLTPVAIGGIVLNGVYRLQTIVSTTPGAFTYTITAASPATYTDSSTVATTAATGTGTTATLTFSARSYAPTVGGSITVTTIVPSGYRETGDYITASSTTTVAYANTTTAAQTVAGTIRFNTVPVLKSSNASPTVSVVLKNHGLISGDTFAVLTSVTVGGLTIYGQFTVSTVIDADNFSFNMPSSATSSATAAMNSGNVNFVYYLTLTAASSAPVGYGRGGYGRGGYGTGATLQGQGTPITATDWTLDNFGQLLVGVAKGGPIYYWDPGSNNSTASVIETGPPANGGVFTAMPQRQLIAWASSYNGIQEPLLIRWCDVNDFSVWNATAINQAGSYRIPSGSKIVGALQFAQQGLIWTDIELWSMQYQQPPYVYGFNMIASGCGMVGEHAAVQLSSDVYWMSQKQFFVMDGQGVKPLDCSVWDAVFQNLNTGTDANGNLYTTTIRAAANSQFNEVTWYYPSANGGGIIDSYVKYNPLQGTWDYGSDDGSVIAGRTAWIDQSVLGAPIGAGSDNYIYQHEVSTNANELALPAYFETGYASLSEGQEFTFIDWILPDMKWGTFSGAKTASINITFYMTDFPGDTPREYGPYTVTQASEYINTRMRGRQLAIKVESDDLGSFWRIGAVRYRYAPSGRR
jgi:hypothetical protein